MNYFFKSVVVWGLILFLAHDAAGEVLFRAFSLSEAQRRLQASDKSVADVMGVANITRPLGLVYDEAGKDLILVGEADVGKTTITLDDVAVAMRALLKQGKVPVVSIDRTADTDRTGKQAVRFEGGIENTQFGKDLLDADVVLKKLGLGLLPAEIWGVRSYTTMAAEEWQTSGRDATTCSRFWFMPSDRSQVAVRPGVAVVDEIRIAVQTQLMGGAEKAAGASGQDEIGEKFSASIAAVLGDLALENPSLGRLEPLFRLTGLVQGFARWQRESRTEIPNLIFWLEKFPVQKIETPTEFDLLKSKPVERPAGGAKLTMTIDGGIDMEMLISDWKDGSPAAFKQLVLASRPKNRPLVWQVPLDRAPQGSVAVGTSKTQAKAVVPAMTLRRQVFSPDGLRSTIPPSSLNSRFAPSQPTFSYTPSVTPIRYSDKVGGVMLSGSARVVGDDAIGATVAQLFSLVATGNDAVLTTKTYRQFVTALWSVYYSKEDPGISIDPIGWGVDKQLVRYIGRVVNTDLGRVMREADYTMKKWAVGTERPDIPGFRDVDTISGLKGTTYADAFRRFWFVPTNMTFKASDNTLIFDAGKVVLKTEFMVQNKSTKAADPDLEFADFFTKHYDQIGGKYPIFTELFEYAKLVSLAKYLKEQGVPLQWFLIAHLDQVLTEDSKGAVDTLSKGSRFLKDFRIEGGVEMPGRYVLDQTASAAIQKATARVVPQSSPQSPPGDASGRQLPALPARSFEFERRNYSVVPQHSRSSGKDLRGVRYQTDIAVKNGDQPGLELVRYFKPVSGNVQDNGQFGKGWHLLIPFRMVPVGRPSKPFGNVLLPEKMAIRNLVNGKEEILSFEVLSITNTLDGQVVSVVQMPVHRAPDLSKSVFVGMFWNPLGGIRLGDKIGNEFLFDPSGQLLEMHLGDDQLIRFEYDYEEAGKEAYDHAPYRLAAEGTGVTKDYSLIDDNGHENPFPTKLRLTEIPTGQSKIFSFGESDQGLIGYAFDAASPLDRQFIAIRSDGKHILGDANGNEIWFDGKLAFLKKRTALVKRVIQGTYRVNEQENDIELAENHSVKLDYEFAGGSFHVTTAKLFKKGLTTPIYAVDYHYTKDRMLARVTPTTHREASVAPAELKAIQQARVNIRP